MSVKAKLVALRSRFKEQSKLFYRGIRTNPLHFRMMKLRVWVDSQSSQNPSPIEGGYKFLCQIQEWFLKQAVRRDELKLLFKLMALASLGRNGFRLGNFPATCRTYGWQSLDREHW